MEIPETIINKAWSQKNITLADPSFEKILTGLSALSTKNFIDKKNKTRKGAYTKVNESHSMWMSRPEAEKTKLLTGYAAAMQNCLNKAFKKSSLPSLLSFLMMQSYFSIPIIRFLEDGKYPTDQKDALEKQIQTLLNQLTIDFNALKTASHYEQNILETARKAEINGDIHDYYWFITSIERSTGLIFNPLIGKLSKFYYYLNQASFTGFLASIKKPLNIIFYLNGFSREELVALTEKVGYGYWLNFEIARRIDFFCRHDYSASDQRAIESQLSIIYHNDNELLKKTVSYFATSKLGMRAFGAVSKQFPALFIVTVFQNAFTLNEYHNRIHIHETLLDELKNSLQPADLKVVLGGVHTIWDNFIQSLLQKDDFYRFSPLLTDFAPYVAAHYQYNYTDQQIKDRMNLLIDAINDIESEWFISKSKAITKYNWYGSSLYILSMSFVNKGVNDPAIKERMERLVKSYLQVSRYKTTNELAIEKAWGILKNCT